jgi:DNA polymerase
LRATQTVFGEGPATARLVLVGEQPGDAEDRKGRPFVGPAGRVLDRALAEAGLDRESVYVTNAVKHFSFEERGKLRIHKKPRASEVSACRPWLEAELEAIRPGVLVLLGATAAQAVFGPSFRVSQKRGQLLASALAPVVIATVHPSSILRAPDDTAREQAFRALVADLSLAAAQLARRHQTEERPPLGS